jgi:hypothetical protein
VLFALMIGPAACTAQPTAEETLRAYLRGGDITTRAALCINPEQTRLQMEDYYARNPPIPNLEPDVRCRPSANDDAPTGWVICTLTKTVSLLPASRERNMEDRLGGVDWRQRDAMEDI